MEVERQVVTTNPAEGATSEFMDEICRYLALFSGQALADETGQSLARIQAILKTRNVNFDYAGAYPNQERLEGMLNELIQQFSKDHIVNLMVTIMESDDGSLTASSLLANAVLYLALESDTLVTPVQFKRLCLAAKPVGEIESVSNDNDTALAFATMHSQMLSLSEYAIILLEHGADPNFVDPDTMMTPTLFAILNGDIELLKQCINRGGNLESTAYPLDELHGVGAGHLALMQPFGYNPDGKVALTVKKYKELLVFLKEKGVDLQICDDNGRGPVFYVQDVEALKAYASVVFDGESIKIKPDNFDCLPLQYAATRLPSRGPMVALDVLKSLYPNGDDAYVKTDHQGLLPFHHALMSVRNYQGDHHNALRWVLVNTPDDALQESTSGGNTPAHCLGSTQALYEYLQRLMRKYSNAERVNKVFQTMLQTCNHLDLTPLQYMQARSYTSVFFALLTGYPFESCIIKDEAWEEARKVWVGGENNKQTSYYYNTIFQFTKNLSLEMLVELHAQKEKLPEPFFSDLQKPIEGGTLLYWVAARGMCEDAVSKNLAEDTQLSRLAGYNEKKDIDLGRAETGNTPIYSAFRHSQYNTARVLINCRADPFKANNDGHHLMHLTIFKNSNRSRQFMQELSGYKNHVNDSDKRGATPLHIASSLGYVDSIDFLLTECADVIRLSTADNYRRTSLHAAVFYRNEGAAKRLLDYAKSTKQLDSFIAAEDHRGETAENLAERHKYPEMVKLFQNLESESLLAGLVKGVSNLKASLGREVDAAVGASNAEASDGVEDRERQKTQAIAFHADFQSTQNEIQAASKAIQRQLQSLERKALTELSIQDASRLRKSAWHYVTCCQAEEQKEQELYRSIEQLQSQQVVSASEANKTGIQALDMMMTRYFRSVGEREQMRRIEAHPMLSRAYHSLLTELNCLFVGLMALKSGKVKAADTPKSQKINFGKKIAKFLLSAIPIIGTFASAAVDIGVGVYDMYQKSRTNVKLRVMIDVISDINQATQVAKSAAITLVMTFEYQLLARYRMALSSADKNKALRMAGDFSNFLLPLMLTHLASGKISSITPDGIGQELVHGVFNTSFGTQLKRKVFSWAEESIVEFRKNLSSQFKTTLSSLGIYRHVKDDLDSLMRYIKETNRQLNSRHETIKPIALAISKAAWSKKALGNRNASVVALLYDGLLSGLELLADWKIDKLLCQTGIHVYDDTRSHFFVPMRSGRSATFPTVLGFREWPDIQQARMQASELRLRELTLEEVRQLAAEEVRQGRDMAAYYIKPGKARVMCSNTFKGTEFNFMQSIFRQQEELDAQQTQALIDAKSERQEITALVTNLRRQQKEIQESHVRTQILRQTSWSWSPGAFRPISPPPHGGPCRVQADQQPVDIDRAIYLRFDGDRYNYNAVQQFAETLSRHQAIEFAELLLKDDAVREWCIVYQSREGDQYAHVTSESMTEWFIREQQFGQLEQFRR